MSENFNDAVAWLVEQLKSVVVAGQLDFDESTFADAVALWAEESSLVKGDDGRRSYDFSDPLASELVLLAKDHYEFFDLCARICAVNLTTGYRLPEPLRLFAASVLTQGLARPTPPYRERKKNWIEQKFLFSLTHEVAKKFDLHLTNGDYTAREGACDAVSSALYRLGVSVKSKEIRDLLTHKSKARLRLEFKAADKIYHMEEPQIRNALSYDYQEEQEDFADKVSSVVLNTLSGVENKR